MNVVREVARAYAGVPGVVAVALGGSAAAGCADEASDVDLYVYSREPLSLPVRRDVATRISANPEVGADAWEPGDEWIDDGAGIHVDIIFRTPNWIEDRLDAVLVRHEASIGYSTALWRNVLRSVPLVDPDGWFAGLQSRADVPYPAALKQAIVAKNHPLLRDALSSFRAQILRAAGRGDAVAVQHRTTALLASFFDVLFALNERPHPGEKRLLRFAREECPKRSPDLDIRLAELLAATCPAEPAALAGAVDALLDGLDGLLAADDLITPRGATVSFAVTKRLFQNPASSPRPAPPRHPDFVEESRRCLAEGGNDEIPRQARDDGSSRRGRGMARAQNATHDRSNRDR
jgi:hypothetical protein